MSLLAAIRNLFGSAHQVPQRVHHTGCDLFFDPFEHPSEQRHIVWNLLADVPNRAAAYELAEVLIEMGNAARSRRRPGCDVFFDPFVENAAEAGPRWMVATRIVLADTSVRLHEALRLPNAKLLVFLKGRPDARVLDFFVQRAAESVFVALGATCLGVVLLAMLRGTV